MQSSEAFKVLRHFWYESIINCMFSYILVNLCELLSWNLTSCRDKTGKTHQWSKRKVGKGKTELAKQ